MDQGWATVIAAVIAVVGTGVGVWVGGRVSGNAAREAAKAAADATRDAAQVAKATADADREDARRQRFGDVVRDLAAQVLQEGQTHYDELNLQVNYRVGSTPPRAADLPTVGSIESMRRLTHELELTVRAPATAQAARRYYATTHWLDGVLLYVEQRDRLPDGKVRLLTQDQFDDFLRRQERWLLDRKAFVNAVRVELGAEPFPDHD